MARRPVRLATQVGRTGRTLDTSLLGGMRRVAWVRILVAGDEVRCETHGTAYRLPCRRPLSLTAALALRDAGVPTVIRTGSSEEPPLMEGHR